MLPMGKTFTDIEKDIDSTLHALPIFRLPLNMALLACLIVYERHMLETGGMRSIFSHDAAMKHMKAGIQKLIPELYRRCSKPTSSKYQQNTSMAISIARQAFVFCNRYSAFEHCFTLYHYNWFQGSIDDNVVSFTYPPDLNFGLGQLNRRLHVYNEERAIGRSRKACLRRS